MSEKRLIDIDELIVIAFNAESRNDIEEEFKKLPKPILPDVCGTRTLDSMTEEEIKELATIAGLKCDCIEIVDPISRGDKSVSINYYSRASADDYKEVQCEIKMGVFYIYGDAIYPVEIVRWFLEKGFNVFGEEK